MTYDRCPNCDSDIKKQDNSLHIWEIEYNCGYKIYGAIDTKTHGKDITIVNKCNSDNK